MRFLLPTLCALGLLFLLVVSGVARAECKSTYRGDELVNDLNEMTIALRSLDEVAFKSAGMRLENGLPCIGTQVPTPVIASAYRYIGAFRFILGDPEGAKRWFRTSLELDPNFYWDINDLQQGHPLREAFENERNPAQTEPVPIEGRVLNLPAGSQLLIDGRVMGEPAATLDRPHLIQQIGQTDKVVRQTFLIQGNAIPERFLRDAAQVVDPLAEQDTKGKRGKSQEKEIAYGDYEVIHVERVRPPAKTPLMVTGVLGVLGSGALYASSFATRSEFDQATTTKDLETYKTATNTLVMAAGATFAAGLGIGYAGIMLDGGGGGLGLGWTF